MKRGFLKVTLLVSTISLFTACTSKAPILNSVIDKKKQDTLLSKNILTKQDKVSLILTFSGGGTRAAAFSYGVLKGLRDYRLLDEIDVISSVSGGSFTSAYFGLYGDKIFDDFESKFLKKKIQTNLEDTFLNPFNWFDLSFSNRSDHVAEFYEKEVFGKKSFKDLKEGGPKIVINATDLSTGNAFSFTPDNFHRLCSNLDDYPIGKAVTASSAVPVIFSAITLKNYGGCKPLSHQIKEVKSTLTHNDMQALSLRKYHDKENYPYLHLVDGGIADNLGIRSLLHIVSELDNDFIRVMDLYGIPNSQKIAIIVVNAADGIDPNIALRENTPDIETTMGAVSTIQLKRYSADTLDLVTKYFKVWEEQINEYRCAKKSSCEKTKFYLIELNFNQLPKDRAKRFSLTKTSLELPDKKVDELIEAGEELLKKSKGFKKLLLDIKEG